MSEKNKKLRLLITGDCPHDCPLCCNKQFNLMDIPVVDRVDYDEVMITGGEPLLFPLSVIRIANGMRMLTNGNNTKFYIYTSVARPHILLDILHDVDGVVLTPHDEEDVDMFLRTNKLLLEYRKQRPRYLKGKSLRLNLFENIKKMIPEDTDLSAWTIKDMKWIKDCPVPDGEDFRRIPKLLTR